MFSIGWTEIFFVAVVALIVVGPKEFPHLLKTVMGLIKHLREIGRDVQASIHDIIDETEIDEVKRQVEESLAAPDFRDDIISGIDEGESDRGLVTNLPKVGDDNNGEDEAS